MKVLKTIPVFILLFTGYLCNAQSNVTLGFSPAKGGTEEDYGDYAIDADETWGNDHVPAERSLPTLVVAGVSIALVLLCILIVAIFGYAWKKSQEGSMVLNPIPYGEAAVSLQNPSVPESQREWPSGRAVP